MENQVSYYLRFACAKNLSLMVKLLIEYGNADVNQIDSNGENCLFYAGYY